jgi:hypothetical protein
MFARYPDLEEVIAELRDEGVRVTAYVNPYLNVKGDIFTQNENEQIWLTDDQGETLIQDFGQFKVKIVKATVKRNNCHSNSLKQQLASFRQFIIWIVQRNIKLLFFATLQKYFPTAIFLNFQKPMKFIL